MSIYITPNLLNHLELEVDIFTESQNEKQGWCYLFSWYKQKPEARLPNQDPKGVVLSVEAVFPQQKFQTIPEFLKSRFSTTSQNVQQDSTQLEITAGSQQDAAMFKQQEKLSMSKLKNKFLKMPQTINDYIKNHFLQQKQMLFRLVVNQHQCDLFDLKYEPSLLQIDNQPLQQNNEDSLQFIRGQSFVKYVSCDSKRFRVSLKLLIKKQKFSEESLKGTNFCNFNANTLPYYNCLNSMLFQRQQIVRNHVYLQKELCTPSLIPNKLLLKTNQFNIFGQIVLQQISNISKNTDYIVEYFIFVSQNFQPHIAKTKKFWSDDVPETLEKNKKRFQNNFKQQLIKKGITCICKSKNKQLNMQFLLSDLLVDFEGIVEQENVDPEIFKFQLSSPLEVVLKLYQLKNKTLLYNGYTSFLAPVQPGFYNLKQNFIVPRNNRMEHEKTQFQFSSFGNVKPISERSSFGLIQQNNIVEVEMQFSIQHFIQSSENKMIRGKAAGFGQMTGFDLDKMILKLQENNPDVPTVEQLKESETIGQIQNSSKRVSLRGLRSGAKLVLDQGKLEQLQKQFQNERKGQK